MRDNRRFGLSSLLASGASAYALVMMSATCSSAEPSPTPSPSESDNPCDLIVGLAKDYCEDGEPGSSSRSTPNDPTSALDPLTSLARGCADAAAWTVDTLSKAVKETATVDFTNTAFLSQYAVVFAAATILTLILWLLAVAKRAIRGVPLTTAVSEAIGFLWLTVLASAFTPLILYTLVSATDAVTEVIAGGTSGQTDVFFGTFSEALKKDTEIGGGPIMLIVVSLVTILAAGILYLELFIRAILLYVGALLGVVVYAGLVDKNMWGHVRRWAGLMIAVIMVKPVIVIVLGLAGALTSSDDGPDSFSAVVSGLAIILLAIFASAMIYRFVPGFGDEIASARSNAKLSTDGGRAAAVISSPAGVVSQGIKTHSGRGGGGESGGGGARPSNPVSGGVAAHSSRPSSGGGGGGGGGVPSPAPTPRSSSPTSGTPHSSRSSLGNRGTGNNSTGGGGR
ncbi:hypothetical protein SSPS47_15395 [Streptomyces sp. S4.7]|uniref:hypothetical protein n=1 Tax=Streptomyces sp. S4.7 TaxID=2705439 RepID=UPI001398AEBF|nr:hypothetical protein [Streptomyces sp. S4.7]QHY96503.1 hypothetical protein SSPS47_15395 [Streptomyces sp. S4.7]